MRKNRIKIISGGQTGVDRAALDAAIAVGLPYGGFIPKGRMAEDGPISEKYRDLTETDRSEYIYRTEKNVIHSDATLILGYVPMSGGTEATNKFCHLHKKTHIFIDLDDTDKNNIQKILVWLKKTQPKILNIAGPRESNYPGIYKKVRALLEKAFGDL